MLNRRWKYVVSGKGIFPLDMLRYDSAWPLTSEDVTNLGRATAGRNRDKDAVRIALCSVRPPTCERWASFGWAVGAIEAFKL